MTEPGKPRELAEFEEDSYFTFVDPEAAATALHASKEEAAKTFLLVQHTGPQSSRVQACGTTRFEMTYDVVSTVLLVTKAAKPSCAF